MTYKELKEIAQPYIRKCENLPSNSFLLLNQLGIPFKTEKQCGKDFSGQMNPLYNSPAFLLISNSETKIMYYNSNTRFWNFYIFHEAAHYILGHEQNSPQNEMDADMLACIIAAPVENLPSYIKSARDLSSTCQIPIDKAEMYWQEIKYEIFKPYKKYLFISFILIIVITFLFLIGILMKHSTTSVIKSNDTLTDVSQYDTYSDNFVQNNQNETNESLFYIVSSGKKYHKSDCQYIKYKTNVISVSIDEAQKLNFEPCEKCIK